MQLFTNNVNTYEELVRRYIFQVHKKEWLQNAIFL